MIMNMEPIGILPNLFHLIIREICLFLSVRHPMHARILTILQLEFQGILDWILALNLKYMEAFGSLMSIKQGKPKEMVKNLRRESEVFWQWIGIRSMKIYML